MYIGIARKICNEGEVEEGLLGGLHLSWWGAFKYVIIAYLQFFTSEFSSGGGLVGARDW